jgi:hypothetical protein
MVNQTFPVLPVQLGVVRHVSANIFEADPDELVAKGRLKNNVLKLAEQNRANRGSGTDEDQIAEKKAATRNTKDYTRNLRVGDAVESIAQIVTGKIMDPASHTDSLRSYQKVYWTPLHL